MAEEDRVQVGEWELAAVWGVRVVLMGGTKNGTKTTNTTGTKRVDRKKDR